MVLSMLYAEGRALCLLTLGHISAYNMDKTMVNGVMLNGVMVNDGMINGLVVNGVMVNGEWRNGK